MAAKFYGNKESKVLHSSRKKDACRASEIKPENRANFSNPEAAEKLGYRLCKICFK